MKQIKYYSAWLIVKISNLIFNIGIICMGIIVLPVLLLCSIKSLIDWADKELSEK